MRHSIAAALVAAAVLAGCSSDPGVDLGDLPPENTTPTTSSPPSTTPAATAAPAGPTTTAPAVTPTTQPKAWTPATSNLVGLPSECGSLSYVTSRPDRDELITGIALQGLWSSTDGGATWSHLGTGPGSDEISNRTSAIVFDPADPQRFWESGIYGGPGAFRTDDGGATFEALGDVQHSDLVSVDLSDPERRTLLSGMHERSNVFRSTDGGATWADVSGGLPADTGQSIAPHVIDAQTHLLGTKQGSQAGVFRTTDGGQTWTRVFDHGVSGRPVVSSADGAIYWLLDEGGGIIRSDDAGVTWTQSPVPGMGKYVASLVELPDGRLATYGDGVVLSDATRTTWRTVGPPIPYAANGLAYSPFRKAFYVWRFDCAMTGDNAIVADSILQVPFDFEVE